MKLEEINALYEKAYANVGPEQADIIWQSWAGRAANAWPALYRELLAARELRDSFAFIPGSFRKVEFENLVTTSRTIPNVQAYDAARRETDK